MSYSNSFVSNSPNFTGNFLSADIVKDAAKVSRKYYIKGCQTNGIKIEQEKLDSFGKRADEIINQLNDVAKTLPEEIDLILSKEKDMNERKSLCLDFVHAKLGNVEVFGTPEYCRKANVRRNYGNALTLNSVDTAIEGVSSLTPEKLTSRFIAMNEGRITSNIQQNSVSLKKSKQCIDELVSFTDKHTDDRAKYLKGRLMYEYNKEAEKAANKKENRKFLFKNFFGIS